MFAISRSVRMLVTKAAEKISAYRRKERLKPYLVLVPGYAWGERLRQEISANVKPDPKGLPLPGGEFLDLADAAMRTSRVRRARTADVFEAARAAARAMVAEDEVRPSVIGTAADGMMTAYASGLTAELMGRASKEGAHGRVEMIQRGMRAFAENMEKRGCALPENAMMECHGCDTGMYGMLVVFGFYDLSAAQEIFLRELAGAFKKDGKPVEIFSPVPEEKWSSFASRTVKFFSEAFGQKPERNDEAGTGTWKVYRAGSIRDEAALAAELVEKALASVKAEEITVAARNITPYVSVLAAIFRERGIAFSFAGGSALAELAAGRFVQALFELADTFAPAMKAGRERFLPLVSLLRLFAMPACAEASKVQGYARELTACGIVTIGDLRRMVTAEVVQEEDEIEGGVLKELAGAVELLVVAMKEWGGGEIEGMGRALGKMIRADAPGAGEAKRIMREIPTEDPDKPGLVRYMLTKGEVREKGKQGILVGDVISMRGITPKYMVLMGVNEGVFPRRLGGSGLFGYDLRAELNDRLGSMGVRFPQRHDVLLEERLLFALMTASSENGAITCSGGENIGGLSRMVREMFPEAKAEEYSPGVGETRGAPEAVREGYADFLKGLADKEFTPAEGKIAAEEAPKEVRLTASTIENYLTCPYLALLRFQLKVPERLGEPDMDPIARSIWGRTVHEILEVTFRDGRIMKMSAEKAGKTAADAAKTVLDRIEQKGLVRKGLVWTEKRARIVRQIMEYTKAFVKEGKTQSVEGEQTFEVTVKDKKAKVRGRADRVDRMKDGALRIVDYKTGRPGGKKEFAEQMAVYRWGFAQILGLEAETIEPEIVYFDRPLTDEVEVTGVKLPPGDSAEKGIKSVVDGYREGIFMRYPESDETCGRCAMYQVCLVSAAALRHRKGNSADTALVDESREALGG